MRIDQDVRPRRHHNRVTPHHEDIARDLEALPVGEFVLVRDELGLVNADKIGTRLRKNLGVDYVVTVEEHPQRGVFFVRARKRLASEPIIRASAVGPTEDWLTLDECAAILHTNVWTFRRTYIHPGLVVPHRFGRRVLVRREDLDAILTSQRKPPGGAIVAAAVSPTTERD